MASVVRCYFAVTVPVANRPKIAAAEPLPRRESIFRLSPDYCWPGPAPMKPVIFQPEASFT